METIDICPKCGAKGITNVFFNAERTKGKHKCHAPGCGFVEYHEPPSPPPPPLPYRGEK